jgi:tetratricopeptide (TPR) repeat protein
MHAQPWPMCCWTISCIFQNEVRRDAHAAAVRALELDRNLADAHLALARFLSTIDWNVDTAELEVNQALELNPRNLQALRLASELASTRGQTDRALDFASKAIVNDPLGSRGFTRIAAAEIGKGNLVGAAAALRKAHELNRTAAAVHYLRGSVLVASGVANCRAIGGRVRTS